MISDTINSNYILNSLHASIGYTKISPNILSKDISVSNCSVIAILLIDFIS